jgi:hypothetical protein
MKRRFGGSSDENEDSDDSDAAPKKTLNKPLPVIGGAKPLPSIGGAKPSTAVKKAPFAADDEEDDY